MLEQKDLGSCGERQLRGGRKGNFHYSAGRGRSSAGRIFRDND